MPIYEYECSDCGAAVERLQKVGDPPPDACEACGGEMVRQISAPAFQFKGSGWYVTDYSDRKSSGGDKESDGKDSGDEAPSSEKASKPAAEAEGATSKKTTAPKEPPKSSAAGD